MSRGPCFEASARTAGCLGFCLSRLGVARRSFESPAKRLREDGLKSLGCPAGVAVPESPAFSPHLREHPWQKLDPFGANLRPYRRQVKELTKAEIEVLRLVAGGLTDKEIAQRVFVSEAGVRKRLRSIYAKFELPGGADSRTAAVAHGFRHGLLQ